MHSSKQTRAILQALLVTFLWSTSWILIKISLNDIPPLIFAGLRYSLAVLLLVPALVRKRKALQALTRSDWIQLALLGVVFYALAQGGQFLTLMYLDAVPFSLLLNFSTVVVAVIGIFSLREIPTLLQWGGVAVFLGGVLIYFLPKSGLTGSALGVILAALTVLANAVASIQGRAINREKRIPPMVVTGISMGVGAALLLGSGLLIEPWPHLSLTNILVILWMGAVNTAFAFYLWNHTLQHLSAVDSSIINNTMLIQIAALAWIFLGEALDWLEILGLALAAVGIFLANFRPPRNYNRQD
jgi:drug/metabolite transporter (DMT)-like permease